MTHDSIRGVRGRYRWAAGLLALVSISSGCAAEAIDPRPADGRAAHDARTNDSSTLGGDGPAHDSVAGPVAPKDVDVARAAELLASGRYTLLDLRESRELAQHGWIAGKVSMAWNSRVLHARYRELPRDRGVVLYCQRGNRSASATLWLASRGFAPLFNILGGFVAWRDAGLPVQRP